MNQSRIRTSPAPGERPPSTSKAPVRVLKLGSSVLGDGSDLPAIARVLAAERARGSLVVAVVSAFAGTTDRLLARARRLCREARPASVARLLATGEDAAAASLVLALEEAGVPARLLEPRQVGLLAAGPPLEAEPLSLDPGPFRRAFAEQHVVVLPGFHAVDAAGETVLLGRGGTDLSALFVAARLGAAECRLLKDTGGVFEADPNQVAAARRFLSLSWQQARRLGGRVVQDRALALARREGRPFVVAALSGSTQTRIGPYPTRLACDAPCAAPRCQSDAQARLCGFAATPQPALAISATASTRRATSSGVV